jgi:hypothetical protein
VRAGHWGTACDGAGGGRSAATAACGGREACGMGRCCVTHDASYRMEGTDYDLAKVYIVRRKNVASATQLMRFK